MIGVLVSGEGSNLQALIDEGLPIAAVASNRSDAPALARAGAAGIPSAVFPLDQHASREERDGAMADWLDRATAFAGSCSRATCTCCGRRFSTGSPSV